MTEHELIELITALDKVIEAWPNEPRHNLAGALLSRVVHLMESDPSTGKQLVQYVWETLDEIETNNPNHLF